MFKNILLLDLDFSQSNEIAALLYARGFLVTRCDSIITLEGALKGDWDLILTDWEFYHLGGGGLIRHLQPERQPVLIFSHLDTAAIAAEALEAGASGVYSKYGRTVMLEDIERQLEDSPSHAASGA